MGRGEMMCVMGIKGAESGGNKEKDLIINSEKGREVWEVKEDPTGIRMAQSGFSGRFEYIQKMSQFYNMLKIIELDSEKDDVLLENLKKVFAQEQVANDMLSILKFNFRGDGYGQSKKDKEEGTAITKANFFDRMIVAAEFPTGVIDLHYTGFQKLSKLKADILKNSDLINLVYKNITGVLPSPLDSQVFEGMLNNGFVTPRELTWAAADSALNKINVNLVGLASTGVDYIPFNS